MHARILIAMSGGVDSSVAAHLMQQEGFSCGGARMPSFAQTHALITECAEKAVRQAKSCPLLKPETPVTFKLEMVSRSRMPVNPAYKALDARTWELTAESMEKALFFNW